MLLLSRDATVTICHSQTPDLAAECRRSDIIISAAGSPGLITSEHVRSGQTVIDVGITAGKDGLLHGDVAFDEVSSIVSDITPVPGGIGVIAGSFLARNLITAAEMLSADLQRL
jgi:methylenetetrahydrofolate dehydrogenase (NADP+)/methenyltetrahydrofolate cyclohydrolase